MPYVDFRAVKAGVPIDRAAKLLNLELKQSSHQLRGFCPACQSGDDRSLAITPGKGVYYCHAGQVGGDCISLVAHILGLSMKDAAEWLQDTLPETRPAPAPQKPEVRTEKAQPASTGFDPGTVSAKLAYTDEVAALGISEADASRLGIGFHSASGFLRGRVAFPIRDDSGLIVGFIGYSPTDQTLKVPTRWMSGKVVPLRQRA